MLWLCVVVEKIKLEGGKGFTKNPNVPQSDHSEKTLYKLVI